MKKIIWVVGVLFVAGSGFSAWNITSKDQKYLMTFDEDIPWVYRSSKGAIRDGYIGEPGSYTRMGFGIVLFSESVAASHQCYNGDGLGDGRATHFLSDCNLNGKLDHQDVGYSAVGVKKDVDRGMSSYAYKLAQEDDFSFSCLYLRIQNKTGDAVAQWAFSADIYYGEPDLDNFSVLTYAYAVDSGTDPNSMDFIPFGTAPEVRSGDVIRDLAGTLNETVTTERVPDGGYIVLAFRDPGGDGGSDIYLDNIGVIACREKIASVPMELEQEPAPSDFSLFSKGADYSTPSGKSIIGLGVFSLIGIVVFSGHRFLGKSR